MRPAAAKNRRTEHFATVLPSRLALITATDAKFRPEDAATKILTSEFADKDTNFVLDFVGIW